MCCGSTPRCSRSAASRCSGPASPPTVTIARRTRLAWLLGGGFAVAFLVGQYLAWQQLQAAGYYAAINPANAAFYLLTGVHAVHLMGGLVAWTRTAARMARGAELDEIRLGVELCTVYWHYLLLVWIVLFSLLLLT